MERRTDLRAAAVCVLLAALACASLVWGSVHALRSSSDLMLRVRESKAFLAGLDPYEIPDMTYPPSAPPVFAWLGLLPSDASARVIWLVLNLAACGLLIREIVLSYGDGWSPGTKLAFGLMILAMKPVRLGLGMGQYHLIPVWAVLAAHRWDRAGRFTLAGPALALALIKPTMALPFAIWFAIRGSWKSLGVACAIQALLFAIASAWLGVGPAVLVREWLHRMSEQTAAGTIDLPSLARAVGGGPSAAFATTALALACGAAATYAFKNRSDRGLLAFEAMIAAVFAYHRPYDLTLLAICVVYVIDQAFHFRFGSRRGLRFAGLAAAAVLIIPNDPLAKVGLGKAYELGFIAMCLILGALVFGLIAREPNQGAGGDGSRSGEDR